MSEKELAKIFGMNLKKIRTLSGLSQRQLSKVLDIERTYLVAMESGKRSTSFAMLSHMSKALRCSPAEFFMPKSKHGAEVIHLNATAKAHDHLENVVRSFRRLKDSALALNLQKEDAAKIRLLKKQGVNVELLALLPFLSEEAQELVRKFAEGYLGKSGDEASLRVSHNIVGKLNKEIM